jgi:hypothetical protein
MSEVKAAIAVIGSGEAALRHFDAALRYPRPSILHFVSPDVAAREAAQSAIALAKKPPHTTFLALENISALPGELHLAVVATPAADRRAAIETLIAGRGIGSLLLEPFVFPRRADFTEMEKVFDRRNIAVYVHMPRRMWPGYASLRSQMVVQTPLTVAIEVGRGASLSANAIQYVDLAAYLSGSFSGFRLDGSRLMPGSGETKRAGIIEFKGAIAGYSGSGDTLSLRSRPDKDMPTLISVMSGDRCVLVNETKSQAVITSAPGEWNFGRFEMPQTDPVAITQAAITDLLHRRSCDLPTYSESARLHKQLIAAFLQALGKDPNDDDEAVPLG